MEFLNPVYPMRAVIRCKAKQQLMTNIDGTSLEEQLDESLFDDLATTLFQAERWLMVYQPCETREAANAVENEVALALAATYQQIKQQQQNPIVQQLNSLLR